MSRRDLSARARVVFDPFAGSGSTIIAAEKVGRQAFCIEIDARYVDTAVRRNERPATPFWNLLGRHLTSSPHNTAADAVGHKAALGSKFWSATRRETRVLQTDLELAFA